MSLLKLMKQKKDQQNTMWMTSPSLISLPLLSEKYKMFAILYMIIYFVYGI